ncbi:HAD family phosphatase [Candidatus Microgenomates bacterium]|nr:HAD family phosphatase [Candidatus Microgenomates bacterium]MBI2622151.1 HAD family phosphatase [Candidatus Microgenomates bacterium]
MGKPLLLNGIQAIIFDMDDLMINSHPVHMEIFEQVLNKYGVSLKNPQNTFQPEEESKFFGKKIIEALDFFRDRFGLKDRVELEEMNKEFNRLLSPIFEEYVEPMPGLDTLIVSLKGKYKLALSSSSKRDKINLVLRKLHLKDAFEAIVSGEDEIKHGKPAPDIFLKAAEKLRVSPSQCLVLEDAKNGVEAAKAASMHAVGVHNQFTFQRLGIKQDLRAADLQVNSLHELTSMIS